MNAYNYLENAIFNYMQLLVQSVALMHAAKDNYVCTLYTRSTFIHGHGTRTAVVLQVSHHWAGFCPQVGFHHSSAQGFPGKWHF